MCTFSSGKDRNSPTLYMKWKDNIIYSVHEDPKMLLWKKTELPA